MATPEPDVSAVWLIDARSDRVLKLAETGGYVIDAGFDPARPEVGVGLAMDEDGQVRQLLRFALEGQQLEQTEWSGLPWRAGRGCVEIRSIYADPPRADPDTLVEVAGRRYEGISCGPISPDGRLMTYWIWADAPQGDLPWKVDQWVVDLASDQRRLLHEGLVHCGGCDGVPSAKWSPSGRYMYFSDVVGGGDRFFVSDVRTAATRQMTDHIRRTDFDVPAWSPVADLLLHSDGAGATVLEDVTAGSRTVLRDMPWPARFDPAGAYVYSPGWTDQFARAPVTPSTSVFHVAEGRVVASLAGQPAPRRFIGVGGPPIDEAHVVATSGGFTAALQAAPDCTGTAIYSSASLVACVRDATRPEISPDGTKIALARWTGDPVPRECAACVVREIVVIEAATGRQLISTGQRLRLVMDTWPTTSPSDAAEYFWNEQGTHLIVTGPPAR